MFPGQGGQRPNMLHALAAHPEAARAIDEASAVLDRDAWALDSAPALRSTEAVQLCLLIAGVAAARVLAAQGHVPDMVAGLSIGAYPAAVVAGALAYTDAVRLVAWRGQLMAQAYPRGYGMTAVLGLTLPAVRAIVAAVHAPHTPVFVANINADTQIVVAGRDDALQRVADLAHAQGAQRIERLDVAVPSHCALLDAPAAELARRFAAVDVRAPRITYLSGNAARALFTGERIADDLAGNMARPVRWHDTVRLARERGARLAVEMPGGNALTRLAAGVFDCGDVRAVDAIGPDDVSVWLKRERIASG